MVPGRRVEDRRIQKTQKLLTGALDSLIREKPYEAISVREILERANVGRSTFYLHFQDKDALLASCIHDMLRAVQSEPPSSSAKGPKEILSFSLPIFEHLYRHRQMGEGRMGAKGRAVIHEHLRGVLVESITENVKTASQRRRKGAGRIPADLLVAHIASTFILVLNWWIESGSWLPPKDVDDLFAALVLPTVAATLP
jgi:AcrR family transcriptional regulator